MTIVVDASMVVAALADSGPVGRWADELLGQGELAAPHLMSVEASNILRCSMIHGEISEDVATLAHTDLTNLSVTYFPYEPFATRIWDLRHNLTSHDAWYVALAERLDAPLATLDRRLTTASGVECRFLTPGSWAGPGQ